jgi:predicted Zn-dependent protease with MMP-like domain
VAGNLADPDYEPSDEELQQLAHDAFAEVPARQREAQRRMWDEIAALRAQVLARLATREPAKP